MGKEIWKSIEVDGDSYLVRKFDAMTGLQIARLLIAKAAPLLPLLTGKEKAKLDMSNEAMFDILAKIADSLSDEDIALLLKKCLRSCFADLPAGKQAIMDEYGNYGVEGIEYDFVLSLRLCYEAIQWGASDFFGGKGLALMGRAT